MSQVDIDVRPPRWDQIVVKDIGPSFGILTYSIYTGPSVEQFSVWLSMMAEVDWYVLFYDPRDAVPADPDETARGELGVPGGLCFRVPANFELQRKIQANEMSFKVKALVDGALRIHQASHVGSGDW